MNIITLPANWHIQLSNRDQVALIRHVSANERGVFVTIEKDTLAFLSKSELEDLVRGESVDKSVALTKEEAVKALSYFSKADSCHSKPYDPFTDLVVFFHHSATRPVDTLPGKRQGEAKAWWVRPGSRCVRYINLDDTEDAILRFALS